MRRGNSPNSPTGGAAGFSAAPEVGVVATSGFAAATSLTPPLLLLTTSFSSVQPIFHDSVVFSVTMDASSVSLQVNRRCVNSSLILTGRAMRCVSTQINGRCVATPIDVNSDATRDAPNVKQPSAAMCPLTGRNIRHGSPVLVLSGSSVERLQQHKACVRSNGKICKTKERRKQTAAQRKKPSPCFCTQ